MKKRFLTIIGLAACCLLLSASAFAAGSACTLTAEGKPGNVSVYTWAWLSDDTSGAVTCTAKAAHGYVIRVVTVPDGTAAPTADYDITISDQDGADVMGGALTDRSATVGEQAVPLAGAAPVSMLVSGTLTVAVTAAGNEKEGEVVLYLQR